MTPKEYAEQQAKDKKAWQALFDCKDTLVECGERWKHEADAVNKILADNIPF